MASIFNGHEYSSSPTYEGYSLIVSALWYGPTKPAMDILLKPVLEQISTLACKDPKIVPSANWSLVFLTYLRKLQLPTRSNLMGNMGVSIAQIKGRPLTGHVFIHPAICMSFEQLSKWKLGHQLLLQPIPHSMVSKASLFLPNTLIFHNVCQWTTCIRFLKGYLSN